MSRYSWRCEWRLDAGGGRGENGDGRGEGRGGGRRGEQRRGERECVVKLMEECVAEEERRERVCGRRKIEEVVVCLVEEERGLDALLCDSERGWEEQAARGGGSRQKDWRREEDGEEGREGGRETSAELLQRLVSLQCWDAVFALLERGVSPYCPDTPASVLAQACRYAFEARDTRSLDVLRRLVKIPSVACAVHAHGAGEVRAEGGRGSGGGG
eukprot:26338-Rhodomonas_salina.1